MKIQEGSRPPLAPRCRRPWYYLQKIDKIFQTLWYPDEAGLIFYSSGKSQYVRLEIHYNNQEHKVGIHDSSGIRFFYSNQIRKYDVGVLEIGVIYSSNMVIPPNQNTFSWPGVCPAKCTQEVSLKYDLKYKNMYCFFFRYHATCLLL